jgi:NUDIX domain
VVAPRRGIDPGETPQQAAYREFEEETGVNPAFWGTRPWDPAPPNVNVHSLSAPSGYPGDPPSVDFYLVVFIMPSARLTTIAQYATANLAPSPANPNRPTGNIKDWELASVAVVTKATAIARLGKPEAIPPVHTATVTARKGARPWTQQVNWYDEMGTCIWVNY